MKTSDFYYDLPEGLIAQTPVEPRDSARLLVMNKETGELTHTIFNKIGEFLKEAKKKGFEIIAAERKNAVSLFETDLTSPLLLAVGGEKRGLSKKVSDEVTKNVFIPYGSDFRNALGTAAATAVFAFEILRQRKSKCT